jgi:hypothetical protein
MHTLTVYAPDAGPLETHGEAAFATATGPANVPIARLKTSRVPKNARR